MTDDLTGKTAFVTYRAVTGGGWCHCGEQCRFAGRAGRRDKVADAVLYLCGPGGSYVTGVALPVAGGVPFGI